MRFARAWSANSERPFVIGIKAQDLIGRVLRKSLKKHSTEYFAHFRIDPAAGTLLLDVARHPLNPLDG